MYKSLPDKISIFPLKGVIMLPDTTLPLNIFEPRYLSMIENALKTSHRMIGIIQPKKKANKNDLSVYLTGCLGKIIKFEETTDGRYLISLRGISRINIVNETLSDEGYLVAKINNKNYLNDINKYKEMSFVYENDQKLKIELKNYFKTKKIETDWGYIEKCANVDLVDQISMICPFTSEEKQMLLESENIENRYLLLTSILEMNNINNGDKNVIKH
jgi:Lon protease-like protein|tara:strand:- start:148 stop:795 length:648 start_codon:yes stop_codon:yes gene_type:complete